MITVYSKNYCPYCTMAKKLLTSLDIAYTEIDLTSDPDKMAELVEKSGLMTVPQIFVGDKCLGGYDAISALNNEGKLVDICKA